MQKKIACFAGHSLLCDCTIIERIMDCAEYYICTEGINEFWVGSYGDFDRYAQKAINKLKSRYPYIKLVYVVPYLSKIKKENKAWYAKVFDETMVADIPKQTPMRYRILKTNQYMVDHADLLICYVEYEWGGACKTLEYAKRRNHIKTVNLHTACFYTSSHT